MIIIFADITDINIINRRTPQIIHQSGEFYIKIMKAIKIFLVIFLLVICANSYADEWTRDSLDNRRAIQNNSNPPARKIPVHSLELVKDNGIIRRIKAVSLTFDVLITGIANNNSKLPAKFILKS